MGQDVETMRVPNTTEMKVMINKAAKAPQRTATLLYLIAIIAAIKKVFH
jgi:hypothetical protein